MRNPVTTQDEAGTEMDRFIERRHQSLGEADRLTEDTFITMTRREEEKTRQRNRWAWARYFEGMSRTLRSRADEYEERARRLIGTDTGQSK